jgi:hypothetical protein
LAETILPLLTPAGVHILSTIVEKEVNLFALAEMVSRFSETESENEH